MFLCLYFGLNAEFSTPTPQYKGTRPKNNNQLLYIIIFIVEFVYNIILFWEDGGLKLTKMKCNGFETK